MPDLTLAVTADQWTRIKAAFTDEDGNVPDAADMAAWIKRQIKGKVVQYEGGAASAAASATIGEALDAEGWNE